jgi:uncharacterized protein
MKKTLYTTFETDSGGRYLYDSQTAGVIPTNDLMLKAIDLYAKWTIEKVRIELYKEYAPDVVDGILLFIVRWQKQFGGFYYDTDAIAQIKNDMEVFTESDIEARLTSGGTFQIILNLTEDCNLRCKYCYFSEAYDYSRNRTSLMMSVETGIKALDVFFDLIRPYARKFLGRSIALTFYGGEPLLNLTTLKQLVDYSLANAPLPVSLNITTNGVAMNDEVMDYLVANNFAIAVSLDGSKENHNRNRILADGDGSFDVILRNLKRFCEKYPTYERILLLSCYDIRTDLEANIEFFERNNYLPHLSFINAISLRNTKYYKQFTREDFVRFREQNIDLWKRYILLKKEGKYIPAYLRSYCEQPLGGVIFRNMVLDKRGNMLPYTGTCLPGTKISVRADGTFDICERVNQTLSIGNVEKGLDLSAIKKIIRLYNDSVSKECSDCLVKKACMLCFAQCNEDQSFDVSSDICENIRQGYRTNLSIVYSVLEMQPSAYDSLPIEELEARILYS